MAAPIGLYKYLESYSCLSNISRNVSSRGGIIFIRQVRITVCDISSLSKCIILCLNYSAFGDVNCQKDPHVGFRLSVNIITAHFKKYSVYGFIDIIYLSYVKESSSIYKIFSSYSFKAISLSLRIFSSNFNSSK